MASMPIMVGILIKSEDTSLVEPSTSKEFAVARTKLMASTRNIEDTTRPLFEVDSIITTKLDMKKIGMKVKTFAD